ncbi:hypothetical protein FHX44_112256 [Pseudonocardia hierapolitana]|uniref:Uncharacterized protein n=1 Tax=Pseudonocardia hierapolitana TaxID=1128676 RepID=A0A561SNE0_9PSEU|nr:hypothetical protein FHX44_112256 [Pseudonocardia hierapolitana]
MERRCQRPVGHGGSGWCRIRQGDFGEVGLGGWNGWRPRPGPSEAPSGKAFGGAFRQGLRWHLPARPSVAPSGKAFGGTFRQGLRWHLPARPSVAPSGKAFGGTFRQGLRWHLPARPSVAPSGKAFGGTFRQGLRWHLPARPSVAPSGKAFGGTFRQGLRWHLPARPSVAPSGKAFGGPAHSAGPPLRAQGRLRRRCAIASRPLDLRASATPPGSTTRAGRGPARRARGATEGGPTARSRLRRGNDRKRHGNAPNSRSRRPWRRQQPTSHTQYALHTRPALCEVATGCVKSLSAEGEGSRDRPEVYISVPAEPAMC